MLRLMSQKRSITSSTEPEKPKKKRRYCHVKEANLQNSHFEVSFAEANPEVAELWCYAQNNPTTSHDVGPSSSLTATFVCLESNCPNGCDHTHDMMIKHKVDNPDCPYCSGSRRCCSIGSLAENEHFKTVLIHQWDFERNGNPSDYAEHSGKRVWWKCHVSHGPDCKHEWQVAISKRVGIMNSGCPFCSDRRPNVCCIEMSLANPKYEHIVKYFDFTKNDLKPEQIRPNSNQYLHWLCQNSCGPGCTHIIDPSPLSNIMRRGYVCTHCTDQSKKFCCSRHSLAAFPDVARMYNEEKNETTALEIRHSSPALAWWKCDKGHEFQAQIASRVRRNVTSCRICDQSDMEKAMEVALRSLHLDFTPQYLLPKRQRIDFVVVKDNSLIAIETDGKRWHFDKTFSIFDRVKQRDQRKNQWCLEHNVPLLRIGYSVKFEHYIDEVQDFLDFVHKNPGKLILKCIGEEYQGRFT